MIASQPRSIVQKFRMERRKTSWTLFELAAATRTMKYLESLNPQVVHCHFGAVAGPLVSAGLSAENLLVTWHGYDSDVIPHKRGTGIYQKLFASPATHTANSRFLSNRLAQLGADRYSIVRVPMGVDLDRFSIRSGPPLDANPLRILSVGRLAEMKGHRFLIEAICDLLDIGVPLRLDIVGDGPLAAELECLIQARGHGDSVALLGSQPHDRVRSEMSKCHLFALTGVCEPTGQVETQGVVFVEAQATGRPVVASNVGGVKEVVEDGRTGILCEPGNIDSIKNALCYFHENRAALERFGSSGRKHVEESLSINQMLESFDALYMDRLRHRHSPNNYRKHVL
ncbi:Alpha-D-kanosaminyltransferase [Posidoniimonas polymericola]|uniref:Alpha-D-kanosaminyltransferase n=2 Tax=Posidoniimonas polymericola TaxID=2528002 RepID=A0A5C5YU92_9BACT|nr:Alpha-D-kanosaminyltransferase [Posidoniimonas polymericola]